MHDTLRHWLAALLILAAPATVLASAVQQTEAAITAHGNGQTRTAAAMFERAARAGNRIAQYHYAMMLQRGEATTVEANAPWRWLRRASYAGLSHAQYEFARMYEGSNGIAPSFSTAKYWYQRAARQGHTDAQVRLAALLLDDRAGSADQDAAWRWLLAAARAGHEGALADLVQLYQSRLRATQRE